MKIAVVGTGYVGLVTGTCFAETGNNVICVDIEEQKVASMKAGNIPIYEPHLDVLFERNIKAGRLAFTTSLAEAVADATLIFLALPTPPGEDGSADLSYVLGVADELGKMIKDYKVIIDKSTVPVGTAEKVYEAVATNATVDFDIVSNPEFLREGFAVNDFMKPDRVVIGCSSARAQKLMEELYKPFVAKAIPSFSWTKRAQNLPNTRQFLPRDQNHLHERSGQLLRVGGRMWTRCGAAWAQTPALDRASFPGHWVRRQLLSEGCPGLHKSGDRLTLNSVFNQVMRANDAQKTILFDPLGLLQRRPQRQENCACGARIQT